jgi:hypothetical protein
VKLESLMTYHFRLHGLVDERYEKLSRSVIQSEMREFLLGKLGRLSRDVVRTCRPSRAADEALLRSYLRDIDESIEAA